MNVSTYRSVVSISRKIPIVVPDGKSRLFVLRRGARKNSSGVKEFFRSDGGHDAHGVPAEEDGFARGADSCRLFLQGIFERTARGIDSAISIFERPPHIDGNARVGKRIEHTYLLDIPQIKSIRGVEIHDIPIGCDSPDVPFTALAMERNQFHGKS